MSISKLLTLVIILCIAILLVSWESNRKLWTASEKLEKEISLTEKYVKEKNWEQAQSEFQITKNIWKSTEKTWSILIDHVEMDNINISFVKSENLLSCRDTDSYLAEAAVLKQYITHVPRKESFELKNIF